MQIEPKRPTAKGPADCFTGDVFLDAIARGEEPSRVRVMAVRFTPSARTAWHSHAVGQTLYVTEGRGLIQARDGEISEIRAGDIITTPSGEVHWHGAAQTSGQYLQVDFGRAVAARQVVFDTGVSAGDYPRGYTVTVSTDGVNWSTAASGQGTGQFTTVSLAGTQVRYVRMTLTASSGSWWSVADVRAYTR